MNTSPELIKIGEFARQGGTNLRTLRYYEEFGLLMPASRTGGGIRYYRRADLHRLRMIAELQFLGLTLERIRELMTTGDASEDRQAFVSRVHEALTEQDRLLCAKIDQLEHQRRSIATALEKVEECGTCSHVPGIANNHCDPCRVTGMALPAALNALF